MHQDIGHNFTKYGKKYDFRTQNIYKRVRIRKFKNPNIYDVNHSHLSRRLGKDYFVWTRDCEAFYKDPINWDNIFPASNLIDLKSTSIQAENKYHTNAWKNNYSQKDESKPEGHPSIYSETSGFIIPEYTFLNSLHDVYESESTYLEVLKEFDIEDTHQISPKKFTAISNYRDVLHDQINRQAIAISNINREIRNVLKVYYYELEKAMFLTKKKALTDSTINKIQKDWTFFKIGLREFYEHIIQFGSNPNGIGNSILKSNTLHKQSIDNSDSIFVSGDDKLTFHLEESSYIPSDILDKVLDGYYALMLQKGPIINTASKIASKIRPLDSILEDYCRDMHLKSPEEFINYDDNQDYGDHSRNSEWLNKTYKAQRKLLPNDNQAVNKTVELYGKKFGMSISASHVRRICNV